jgi:hypothetical protein
MDNALFAIIISTDASFIFYTPVHEFGGPSSFLLLLLLLLLQAFLGFIPVSTGFL